MDKLSVRDIGVSGKKVLVRVDFNVPMDEKTSDIMDDSRIKASLPTIRYLIEHRAKVILLSHLGRPNGKVVESMRMAPVASRLSQILGQPVKTTGDCIGPEVEKAANNLTDGQVLLLENLRFHAEEEKGDDAFARALARLGDIYVDDAFGTAHRAHASITGIARYLPAIAGLLLEKEIATLGGILKEPAHPFTALLGGAKVSDKVALLKNIMDKVDCLLIGGGMAATFLKASGKDVGQSQIEADRLTTATSLMEQVSRSGVSVSLPVDVMVADKIDAQARTEIVSIDNIPKDKKIVDIGPRTIEIFNKQLDGSKTVFWNGPMGIYEIPQFAEGTRAMANKLARLKATTVIGGGSTAEAVAEMGLESKMTFVSTGGGASLQFLGGEALPGVEALLNKGVRVEKTGVSHK
ncbi:MAG: phosphoglycerate kinase [Dehalococcoidales bacterium]|nr:phosphoglycerate kinase [Dehalococcoidales bacterium]